VVTVREEEPEEEATQFEFPKEVAKEKRTALSETEYASILSLDDSTNHMQNLFPNKRIYKLCFNYIASNNTIL
jgi:hypothetical protein